MLKMNKKDKIDTFKETVEQLVDALGGILNITSAFHCATRFRVIVKDDSKVNKNKLSNVNKAKGFSKEGEQWQIIFGTGLVNKVFDKYQSMFNVSQPTLESSKKEKVKWNHNYSAKTNIFLISRSGIRGFAEIFIPLIPLFIVGGMSLAINTLITTEGVGKFNNNLTHVAAIFSKLFDVVGSTVMGSLPVFIGYTSAKKWGGNPWFGAAMGLILIAPSLAGVGDIKSNTIWYPLWESPPAGVSAIPVLWNNGITVWNYPLFSIPLVGYQSQIIPVLLVVALMVQLEKGLKKVTHESIAIIVVPLGTIIPTTIIAFAIIGPIGYVLSLAIAQGLRAIFVYSNFPGFGLGGAILGAIYAPIVITGLHQGFPPIEQQLLAQYHESWVTPIACVSNISQAFACLTGAMFIKDDKLKGTAYSGALSANLGITEPAMFGVNINVRHYFLGAIIGSACGGYWLGMTQTTANSLGSASWIGLIQFDFTRSGQYINEWYANVANATPWGKYMTGFNLPPIANAAIAMSISAIVATSASTLLSFSKQGRKNLKEVNKGIPNYKWVDSLGLALEKSNAKIANTFRKILGKSYQEWSDKRKIKYVYSPVSGELINLKNIEDQVFGNELLGKTFAIRTESDEYKLFSPFDGKITNIFETGHAVTITNKENVSVLVHIGLETAKLNQNVDNLKKIKFIKFKKLIFSKVSHFTKPLITNKENNYIADVESKKLVANGAKSNDIFVSILNETVNENMVIKRLVDDGPIKKGQPIFEITQIENQKPVSLVQQG